MVTEAVVFDLGNVLIRWDPFPALAAGVGEVEARRLLDADDFDFHAWNVHQDAGRSFADAVDEVRRTHPHWVDHVAGYFPHYADSLVGAIEGTVSLLQEVAASGVPVFALTNWSGETFHHARERFGFLEEFTDIVVSGDEGLAKPDPAIFRVLEQRTDVPAERTLFTDDSARNVAAAAELGFDAVVFTSSEQLREELSLRGLLS